MPHFFLMRLPGECKLDGKPQLRYSADKAKTPLHQTHMNISSLFTTAVVACAAFTAATAPAAPATAASTAPAAPSATLNGIIFRDYPYTILTVKATSLRHSEEGVYDRTIVLRFHNDDSRIVDIKELAPGETTIEWGPCDASTIYKVLPPAKEGDPLVYTHAGEDYPVFLMLHVQNIGKVSRNAAGMPECRLRLAESEFTYTLSDGEKWIDTHSFAREATVTPAQR